MPDFKRISSRDNQYNTLLQNKTAVSRLNADSSHSITFFAEEMPLEPCIPSDYDCNWFLAIGCRKASVSSCQLGVSYDIPRSSETIQFGGEFVYKHRPGLDYRGEMTLYTDNLYQPPPPLELVATTYLTSTPPLDLVSSTYIQSSQPLSLIATTYLPG